MIIELIANNHWKEGHPKEIISNTEMDKLRRKECLCINCGRKNEDIPYSSCHVAKKIYDEICVPYDMAMAITKCGATDNEGNLLYKPLYYSVSKETIDRIISNSNIPDSARKNQ